MGIKLIPNVGTVPDQLKVKDRLMNMICYWHTNDKSFRHHGHWRHYVPHIDIDRLERECGIRFRRWCLPLADDFHQIADLEVVDEKLYVLFLLKYS